MEDDDLCDRCKGINLEEAFNYSGPITSKGKQIVSLGKITPEWKKSSCQLCRLFAFIRVHSGGQVNRRYHLRAFSSLTRHNMRITKARASKKPSILLALTGTYHHEQSSRHKVLQRAVILPQSLPTTNTLEPWALLGHHVLHSPPAYIQFREWIHQCQKCHSDCCGKGDVPASLHLQVMDCVNGIIVTLEPQMEYVALSYVWGNRHGQERVGRRDASSREQTKYPKLIQDARIIVRNLGFQYLWVDKYSINQKDASELHGLFGQMHQVYEGAVVTVAAAGSDDAESGIPGVSDVPRRLQPRACISGKWYVSTLSDVATALRTSRWMTRGWTYQEFVLSRRCLLFTKSQVYFVCRSESRCEAVGGSLGILRAKETDSGVISPDILGRSLELPKPIVIGRELPKPKTEFWLGVTQYTARQLRYSSDALNAFRGFLARAAYFNYWGVPVMIPQSMGKHATNTDLNAGFAFGLAWHGAMDETWWDERPNGVDERNLPSPADSYSRCRDFPSWSWAGWKGARILRRHDIAWDGKLRYFNNFPNFWIEDKAGSSLTLLEMVFFDKVILTKCLPESSHFIQLENTVVRLRIAWNETEYSVLGPEEWHTEPFWRAGANICRGYWAEQTLSPWPTPQEFEAILLYHDTPSIGSCTLLLIEQHETAYERVGLAWLGSEIFSSLPKSKRRIRLG
jgi:hypothetical protein